MDRGNVKCPKCGMVLAAPQSMCGRVVRCGACHCRFRVVPRPVATDDEVANWLLDEDTQEGLVRVAEVPKSGSVKSATRGRRRVARGKIRVLKLDHNSVYLEFPAKRLLEPEFRSAMPRRCVQCGSHVHLHAHVIIYAAQLADNISLEEEHSAGALELSEQQIRDLTDEQLLKMLPKVPNVPSPGNLPMPYWLCKMCRGTGVISGQIQVNSVTGEGWCRLRIRNLEVATEFLAAAGGRETKGYQELRQRVEAAAKNPWDALPVVVQNRIQQWFKPSLGERFLAYVPSRDHAYTEDGMAGLLISTLRLIYHTESRQREVDTSVSLDLQLTVGPQRSRLRIKTPHWEVKGIVVDRDGIKHLRRGLAAAQFRAAWH